MSTNFGSLKFLTGPLMGRVFSLDKEITTIGRDPGNDIVIPGDLKIAPYHIRLLQKNNIFYIQKHPQATVVHLNKRIVEEAVLSPDSLVEVGEDTCFIREINIIPDSPSGSIRSLPVQSQQRPGEGTMLAPLSTLGIPSLEVTSNTSDEKNVYPLNQPLTSVGQGSGNDIVIGNPIVSRQHIQIIKQGNQLKLVHPHPSRQKTLNGLIYRGRKIRGDEQFSTELKPGDFFRIGNENGSFVTLTYNDGSDRPQEQLSPMQPIRLDGSDVTIGRLQDNKIMLPHPQVSAHHALLKREGGTYRIVDLNSTNHVYVNSQAAKSVLLKMGDEIRIGPYRLVFETTQLRQYDESNNIRIDALNLKKYGNKGVTLLNDISITIEPRKFVAVVGGSGAGKTTLIKALSGLQLANDGKVLYNGQDYYRNLAAYNTQLGYVPQDDIVHKDLTVERALYYAAKMRLPNDFTEEQIQQRINEVLEDVELGGKQKLLIKKLSGGQRKRASIALELLANPSLFFLDEPTSGLDPGLDRRMMFLLRKLADKGHTIILVTHATNNINTCDYVCFLARGGRLAYFGPPEEAKIYFDAKDFAEIYSSLEPTEENKNTPEEAEKRFKSSPDYQKYVALPLSNQNGATGGTADLKKIKQSKRGNGFKQFALLWLRQLELLKNNISNLAILVLEAPLLALLLMVLVKFEIGSGIFDTANLLNPLGSSGDAQRVIFMVAFFAVLFGCINGTREIVKEEAIYRRERTVNLGILPYMLSKIAVLGLLALFQSVSILFIVNAFEPFGSSGVFLPPLLEIYITLALVAVAGVMLGLAVSASAPNDDTANSLLPIIIVPQVIFAGAIIPMKDWFTQIISTIFPIRWAMANLGSSLGMNSAFIDHGTLFGNEPLYHGTLHSATVPALFSQATAIRYMIISWAALGATILVFAVLIGILLKLKDNRA